MIYKEWGKINKSIKCIKTYLEKKPEDYDGWYYLGEILLEDKNYKESIKAFQKALDIKPNEIECLNSIILNYLYLGEIEKALNVVKSVSEIGNQNLNTYWLSGVLYLNKNDFSKALEAYNKCLEGDPNEICYLCMKGRTLTNLYKFEDAITLFEKILTIDPKEVCYFKYYAEIYHNKGDIEKTNSILKDGMKLAQESDNQDEIIKIQEILDELKPFGKIDT